MRGAYIYLNFDRNLTYMPNPNPPRQQRGQRHRSLSAVTHASPIRHRDKLGTSLCSALRGRSISSEETDSTLVVVSDCLDGKILVFPASTIRWLASDYKEKEGVIVWETRCTRTRRGVWPCADRAPCVV